METSGIINSAGLALDIIGAYLIWQYALPAALEPSGERFRSMSGRGESPSTEKLHYRSRSRWGFVLLMAGFAVQLVSNFL